MDDDDDLEDDLVGMIFFVSCSFFCLVVLVLAFVIAVNLYGRIIIASIQFCHPSYLKRLHFAPCICQSITYHETPPTHPFLQPPPRSLLYWKMRFSYLNSRYLRIFAGFLPVKTSNMNRFENGLHCRIAFSKLYNIAAQSLSRHELCCMKIII